MKKYDIDKFYQELAISKIDKLRFKVYLKIEYQEYTSEDDIFYDIEYGYYKKITPCIFYKGIEVSDSYIKLQASVSIDVFFDKLGEVTQSKTFFSEEETVKFINQYNVTEHQIWFKNSTSRYDFVTHSDYNLLLATKKINLITSFGSNFPVSLSVVYKNSISIGRLKSNLKQQEDIEHDIRDFIVDTVLYVLNSEGKQLHEFGFSRVHDFTDEYAFVESVDNKIGCIDTQGKLFIPCIYEYMSPFKNGVSFVRCKNDLFFINTMNERVEMDFSSFQNQTGEYSAVNDIDNSSMHLKEINIKNDMKQVPYINDFAILSENNYSGRFLIHKSGKVLIPDYFSCNIKFLNDHFILINSNKAHFILNLEGRFLDMEEFDEHETSGSSYYREYEYKVEAFDCVLIAKKNGKYFILNSDFEMLYPDGFDSAYGIEKNTIKVELDNKYALVGTDGELLTEFIYSKMDYWFSNRVLKVERDDFEGYLNTDGVEVIPCIYSQIWDIEEDVYTVLWDNQYCYIDRAGNIIIERHLDLEKHEQELVFINGYAIASICIETWKKVYYYGVVDENLKIVIPFIFSDDDYLSYLSEGLFKVKDYYGLISTTGKKLSKRIYDSMSYRIEYERIWAEKGRKHRSYFKEYDWGTDLVEEYIEGKFGYLNSKGEEIIPFIYDKVSNFYNGLAVVGKFKNDKLFLHYINTDGINVFQDEFDYAEDFQNDYAFVKKDIEYFAINQKGEKVEVFYIPQESDQIIEYNDSWSIVARQNKMNGEKYCFISCSKQIRIPFIYESVNIEIINNTEYCIVEIYHKKKGIVDSNGLEILPCNFSSIKFLDFSKSDYFRFSGDTNYGFSYSTDPKFGDRYRWINAIKKDNFNEETSCEYFDLNGYEVTFHDFETPFGFGKYKGKRLSEILANDIDYINWCILSIDAFFLSKSVLSSVDSNIIKLDYKSHSEKKSEFDTCIEIKSRKDDYYHKDDYRDVQYPTNRDAFDSDEQYSDWLVSN